MGRHTHAGSEEFMGSHLRNKLLYVAFALAIQPGMILPEMVT